MKPGMDLPLLDHAIEEPSAFTPEALISAVRAERGLANFQHLPRGLLARFKLGMPLVLWMLIPTDHNTISHIGQVIHREQEMEI